KVMPHHALSAPGCLGARGLSEVSEQFMFFRNNKNVFYMNEIDAASRNFHCAPRPGVVTMAL
ncbi:MAG TPA: hypothetical protein VK991_11105, partial [Halomonas sp.]|nr:hypothetical protein [Halomonas sp.]